jgi:hypothetical protein
MLELFGQIFARTNAAAMFMAFARLLTIRRDLLA